MNRNQHTTPLSVAFSDSHFELLLLYTCSGLMSRDNHERQLLLAFHPEHRTSITSTTAITYCNEVVERIAPNKILFYQYLQPKKANIGKI